VGDLKHCTVKLKETLTLMMSSLSAILQEARGEWYNYASCCNMGDMFFDSSRQEECKAICETCPVRLDCLNAAFLYQDDGVRGGLTAQERQPIIRRLKRYQPIFKLDVLGG